MRQNRTRTQRQQQYWWRPKVIDQGGSLRRTLLKELNLHPEEDQVERRVGRRLKATSAMFGMLSTRYLEANKMRMLQVSSRRIFRRKEYAS
mmetsp:Transcript_11194/g.28662  ORF Transcript_11194/g.28662 Transcript_11194/m.28662 type:complete len:91 (+) Transcript_11194:112-384(+)